MNRAIDRSRLPPLGPEPAFAFPAPVKHRLPNGLEVWTAEHHDVPLVAALLLLRVGASADPPDGPGLAALTADLLDEGSGRHDALELHRALASIGAHLDSEVGPDATVFGLTMLARHLPTALDLLASILKEPWLADDEFERVRDLRLNRLRQLRDVAPAIAERLFIRTLYPGHPYGHLSIGTEASVQAFTPDVVRDFYRRAYGPSRATLLLVGDAGHDAMFAQAERAFGDWGPLGSGVQEDRPIPPDPPKPALGLMLFDRPKAAQSELRVGHVAAARATSDYHALLVLNMVLGGQFVSRLNLNLRERRGYTYGARTTFDFRLGRGPFVAQASVQPDATAAAVSEIIREIRSIREDEPPSEAELSLAKAALTRGYPRGFETAEQVARGAAQLALYGLADDYFSRFSANVRGVDAAAVVEAARRHLRPEDLSVIIVGDRDVAAGRLEAFGLGPVIEIPAL